MVLIKTLLFIGLVTASPGKLMVWNGQGPHAYLVERQIGGPGINNALNGIGAAESGVLTPITGALNGASQPSSAQGQPSCGHNQEAEDGQTSCSVYKEQANCASKKGCYCAQAAGGPGTQCVKKNKGCGPACNFNKDPNFCGKGQQCVVTNQGNYECATICT